MHLQKLERLPATHPSSHDLNQALSGLRVRLGLERLAVFAVRGAIGSSLAAIALALGIWLVDAEAVLLWLAAAPLLAAVAYGMLRWPGRQQTAMTVDQRFGLEERLATAIELADARLPGRFAALQLCDAVAALAELPKRRLVLDRRAGKEAVLALAAITIAATVVVLVPRLPRPLPDGVATDTSRVDVAPVAGEPVQRAVPLEASEQALPTPLAAPAGAPPSADLAARVQLEQAERSALDKLAQALGNISAGQPAADAIQQGDLNAARDQLQNLADNADQLTDAAKRQLGSALQQAADSTAQTDRDLAAREQQTAQALSRSSYNDQRQALRALADQVQRAASRSVPADQLERDLGQLQQQDSATQGASAATTQSGGGQSAASQTGDPSAPGSSANQSGSAAMGSASSGQNGDGAGQQTGSGVGTGTDPDVYADQPSRLNTDGQQVQVPLKLGGGPGVRPSDGTEDQTAPNPEMGARTTAELAQTQQTGHVAPEQNLVPGEQRPVVRGYFR